MPACEVLVVRRSTRLPQPDRSGLLSAIETAVTHVELWSQLGDVYVIVSFMRARQESDSLEDQVCIPAAAIAL